FEPFEARVDVAGGQVVRVVARLRRLGQTGRLRVAEQDDKLLYVVVDGNVVGSTPWQGSLSLGTHTVVLRGEGNLGTQPVTVRIRPNETTPLFLAAEQLGSLVRIEPTPAGATVAIDGVTVGQGTWEGRLHSGLHRIEIADEGF